MARFVSTLIQTRNFALIAAQLVPLTCFGIAVYADYSGLNLRLAQYFFDVGSHSFPLRQNLFSKTVMHEGGRLLVEAGILSWLILLLATWLKDHAKVLRVPALIIFSGLVLGPSIVGYLKSTSPLACPWDTAVFGGSQPYWHMFSLPPGKLPVGHCFPGGHAAGGYTWLSLFFAARVLAPRFRWWAFGGAMLLGTAFALAQESRGAHFLSHDLITLTICWTIGLAVEISLRLWLARLSPARRTALFNHPWLAAGQPKAFHTPTESA